MYYNVIPELFLDKNTAIIGKRNSGKTTILKKLIEYFHKENYVILLFDSATEHEDKSILIDTIKKYPDTLVVLSPEEDQIQFGNVSIDSYPHKIIAKNPNRAIYAFDVSKFLEKGYETDVLDIRESIRAYYKQLVVQELTIMIPFVYNTKKCVVIMDEIEFNSDMPLMVNRCNIAGMPIINAVHDIKSLGLATSFFEIINLGDV
jgi:GTPase SAR1 family protein